MKASRAHPSARLARSWLAWAVLFPVILGQVDLAGAGPPAVEDYAVRMSAIVETNPARISLSWPGDARSLRYSLFKKTRDATSWGAPTVLATNATNFVDTGIVRGTAVEYRVVKVATNQSAATNYIGEGYVYAGFGMPLVDNRGTLLLLVDTMHATALAAELSRLQQDLVGDGWTVVRREVARSESVSSIRTFIRNAFSADPTRVKAVFLFGHIPVPYSGNYTPDGHPDHQGAWPSDGYYGDVDGNWTDAAVNRATATDARNRNIPGDGKFDQTVFPSNLELQVGRVDLANLPILGVSEVELLRRYLNKNHAFRHKRFTLAPRGLIDDHFGVFGGEAFAVNGWRNFAALFGAAGTTPGDWLSTLATEGYLWGYGCGEGSYTSANGVASTELIAGGDPRVVFTFLFGSYFGDWDSPNNLMRASLATPGYTLTSAWAGRPHWVVHHMSLGETIGFGTRLTQNNSTLYAANGAGRLVHVALMGDPTLRLHPVKPASRLVIQTNGLGTMILSWSTSPEPVEGYVIYRAATDAGPFVRVHSGFVTSNHYTTAASSHVYMVRAVKLEETPTGSYLNPSQGVFQDLAGNFGPPPLLVRRQADVVSVSWPVAATDYRLQSADVLTGSVWSDVPGPVVVVDGTNVVTQPAAGAKRFFRLTDP